MDTAVIVTSGLAKTAFAQTHPTAFATRMDPASPYSDAAAGTG